MCVRRRQHACWSKVWNDILTEQVISRIPCFRCLLFDEFVGFFPEYISFENPDFNGVYFLVSAPRPSIRLALYGMTYRS